MNDWNAAENCLIEKISPGLRLSFKLLKALRQAHVLEPVTVSADYEGSDVHVEFYWGCDVDHFSIQIDNGKARVNFAARYFYPDVQEKWKSIAAFVHYPIEEEKIPEFVEALKQVQSMRSLGY